MDAHLLLALRHGIWLTAGAALALVGIGWLAERAWRALRRDRRWAARVDAGNAAAHVLSGTLRCEGPVASFDGALCAAATLTAGSGHAHDAASASVRAERLWLEAPDGDVELRGPVEVISARAVNGQPTGETLERVRGLLGEHAEWAFGSMPVELRDVTAGARVQVAGALRTEARSGGTYRDAAAGRVLEAHGERLMLRSRAARATLVGPVVGAAVYLLLVTMGPLAISGSWARLVSPFHRRAEVARLRYLIGQPYQALSPDDAGLRVALFEEREHAARARIHRYAGALEVALAEAERGEDLPSRREQVLALLALGRDAEAAERWTQLVEEVDRACLGSDDCFAQMAALGELTPWHWGTPGAERDPIDLYFSRAGLAHDPGFVVRMSEMLEAADLESPLLARMRIAWLLERARFDVLVDAHPAARVLLSRARSYAEDDRLAADTRRALGLQIDHLEAVSYLRQGRHEAFIFAVAHRGSGFCPLPELLRLVTAPGAERVEYLALSPSLVERVVSSARTGTAPDLGPRPTAAELRGVAVVGTHLRPAVAERLAEQLDGAECAADLEARDLIELSARGSALEALGDRDSARELRQCVATHRSRLLGRAMIATL